MAYDPNDPADKAIVDGLIEEALEAEREKHEADIEGLKNKNKQLTDRLRKARSGDDSADTAEIDRLERELDESKAALRTAQSELRETNRKLKAAETERDTARTSLETESSFSRNMVVENGLTAALVEAKVAPHFMEAARALLGKQVAVKVDGDNRTAVGPNDKPLGEFVKEWAASEAGKHYVAAPANGGGGANGSNPASGGGSKKISEMSESERTAHYNAVGQAAFDAQLESERTATT